MKNLSTWHKVLMVVMVLAIMYLGYYYWSNSNEEQVDENGIPKPKDGRVYDTEIDIYKILQKGMYSENVKKLQNQLNAKLEVSKGLNIPAVSNVIALKVDGDFGAKTEGLLFILFGNTKTTLKSVGVDE